MVDIGRKFRPPQYTAQATPTSPCSSMLSQLGTGRVKYFDSVLIPKRILVMLKKIPVCFFLENSTDNVQCFYKRGDNCNTNYS